jgi:hypothetical protein
MQPYQQRVVDEKAALDELHGKLKVFLSGDVFKKLDNAEQQRLFHQSAAMALYSYILAERITAFQ